MARCLSIAHKPVLRTYICIMLICVDPHYKTTLHYLSAYIGGRQYMDQHQKINPVKASCECGAMEYMPLIFTMSLCFL